MLKLLADSQRITDFKPKLKEYLLNLLQLNQPKVIIFAEMDACNDYPFFF
jgi:hypothetical protein